MLRFKSNKTVVVMPASIQGYEKNHAYYSSTRIVLAEDPQYRPLFFKAACQGGQSVSGKGAVQAKPPVQSRQTPKSDGSMAKRSKEFSSRTWGNKAESTWSAYPSVDSPNPWSTG